MLSILWEHRTYWIGGARFLWLVSTEDNGEGVIYYHGVKVNEWEGQWMEREKIAEAVPI